MKRLFLALLILLMASPLLAQEQVARMNVGIVGGGTPAAAAECTTSNDGIIGGDSTGTTANKVNSTIECTQITIAATSTVTGYNWRGCDGNADTGTVTISLWTNNAATTPDQPAANGQIAGSDITFNASEITNACSTYATQFWPLASPLEGVASGLYWICSTEGGGADQGVAYIADVGGVICEFLVPGTPGGCSAGYRHQFEAWGCAE